jgi:hypothetical protein
VIETHARLQYGPHVARQAVGDLRADPFVPTANHYGIDTFADSVQGTLLYALRPLPDGRPRGTAVVLGCSSISLDNLTYPMGLLLYESGSEPYWSGPLKLPLYPNRYRRWAVACAPPFTAQMVERARSRLAGLAREGGPGPAVAATAQEFLHDDIGCADVLAQPTYGRQAARVNEALWSRLLPADAPRLVQLDLEAVCSDLAIKDMGSPDSLLGKLLFQPEVRGMLLDALDGRTACWRLDDLARRLGRSGRAQSREGTVFFWGMRPDGRRVPLTLVASGGTTRLAGRDERGEEMTHDFSPSALTEGLAERRLLPSLLTCFTVLAFARGLICSGGYYQAGYLPVMQRGVARAVAIADPSAAERVMSVPTAVHLAGLQFAVHVSRSGTTAPAGPLELAAGGGLTHRHLAQLRDVRVEDALVAALQEILPHVVEAGRLPPGWQARAAQAVKELGGDRLLWRQPCTRG